MSMIKVALCGAHMQGLPLNPQLLALGGEFVAVTQTSANYRLFKLPEFVPERPGLIRVSQGGTKISLEVWQMPIENYGKLVAAVPAPLGFGTITLEDGSLVNGFLCEAYATEGALELSALGGWRNYLASLDK
jgi:hypothetical protein